MCIWGGGMLYNRFQFLKHHVPKLKVTKIKTKRVVGTSKCSCRMARAHGEIRFLRKKEKKNRTSKSVSKKDEKTACFSENHVISADNKEKS